MDGPKPKENVMLGGLNLLLLEYVDLSIGHPIAMQE